MISAWNWLQENHGAVSALAGLATLVVWLAYFQILLNRHRHMMRPKILITRGGGCTADASCMVANMSTEPVYLEAVVLSWPSDEGETIRSLADMEQPVDRASDIRPQIFQGPIGSGEMIDLGSYRDLLGKADRGGSTDLPREFTVTILATHTAEDSLVAAERRFLVRRRDGADELRSPMTTARQIRSRSDRRKLERLLEAEENRSR